MNEENKTLFAELEALLFYYGEPISVKKISDILGAPSEAIEAALVEWEKQLMGDVGRGLMLMRTGERVQLVTKSETQRIGKKLIQEEFKEALTPAALETLSLIAYVGPISRPSLDYIRGVNSSFILRNLLMRGLLTRKTSKEKGSMFAYEVSGDFLKHMGLTKVTDLPEYEKYKDVLKNLEAKQEEAVVQPSGAEQVPLASAETDRETTEQPL